MTRWAALTRGQLVLALRPDGHVACVRWLTRDLEMWHVWLEGS
jgi:hypothetical protein